MTTQEILDSFTEAFIRRMDTGDERKGQAVMNALHDADPVMARELVEAGLDCFYDDSKVDEVLQHVFKEVE